MIGRSIGKPGRHRTGRRKDRRGRPWLGLPPAPEFLEGRIAPAQLSIVSGFDQGTARLFDPQTFSYQDGGETIRNDGGSETIQITSPVGGGGKLKILADSNDNQDTPIDVTLSVELFAALVNNPQGTAIGSFSGSAPNASMPSPSFSIPSPYSNGYASATVTWTGHVGDVIDFQALVTLTGLAPPGTYNTLEPGGDASVGVGVTIFDPLLVTTTDDSGPGSLRYAIDWANGHPGLDTIGFHMYAPDPIITLTSPLPAITDPVIIDGNTEFGTTISGPGATATPGDPAFDGLTITGDGSTVRGLRITSFPGNGVLITGSNNKIQGGWIGPNGGDGIRIDSTSGGSPTSNIIGTDGDDNNDQFEGNVIADNTGSGVALDGPGTSGNVVAGNLIGIYPIDLEHHGNAVGITISGGSHSNLIGTDGDGTSDDQERNVISGNVGDGVLIEGAFSDDNVVAGNYIGTDTGATSGIGNDGYGVEVKDHAQRTRIGDPLSAPAGSPPQGNVISGNTLAGVHILGDTTDVNETLIVGNGIGTDYTGTQGIFNADGIVIEGSSSNQVERNVISGNRGDAVRIEAYSTLNFVENNNIGTDSTGTQPLGNYEGVRVGAYTAHNFIQHNVISANTHGVILEGPGEGQNYVYANEIGTDVTGTLAIGNLIGVLIDGNLVAPEKVRQAAENEVVNNLISGNNWDGIHIDGVGAVNNLIAANRIGTDDLGDAALLNGGFGVIVEDGASGNTIGGTDGSLRNIISANARAGVWLTGSGTSGNVVEGDYIGLAADGKTALGNGNQGVLIDGGASRNTIGGTAAGAGVVISANSWEGVVLSNASNNLFAGDDIGTDKDGLLDRGNGSSGVVMNNGSSGNTIGGTTDAARDVIAANHGHGIQIRDPGTSGNWIAGDYIGLDADGKKALGNADHGLEVAGGTSGNTIGGTAAGAGDVIASNGWDGILIADSGTTGNLVAGDRIGTDKDGKLARGNGGVGVEIANGASSNTVGGTVGGSRNVISDNGAGVTVHDGGPSNNLVAGNFIGVGADGSTALGNTNRGVELWGGAKGNTIGGTTDAARNVISDNGNGLWISGNTSTGNLVEGDYIGLAADGTTAVGNAQWGILLWSGTSGNTIGGTSAGAGDVVSANGWDGVYLYGSSNNLVAGDFVGTDAKGMLDRGNGGYGMVINNGSSGNTVGGTTDAARVIIAANHGYGLSIRDPGTKGNLVEGDYIGLAADGKTALGNLQQGLEIVGGAWSNTIGGTTAGAGDVISANGWDGILIAGVGTTSNLVAGDLIGTDRTGMLARGNGLAGVEIVNGASANTIGGTSSGSRNVISANSSGVTLHDGGPSNNLVAGNDIGVAADGSTALGNTYRGVELWGGASGNTIGGTTDVARNVISGNGDGLWISGNASTGNLVEGDYIGLAADGTMAVGNAHQGVRLWSGTSANTIGGTAAGPRNLISSNGGDGIVLADGGTSTNLVAGDFIGTDVNGLLPRGNGGAGVVVTGGASGNTIGGTSLQASNIITSNIGGVSIYGAGTSNNLVQGNSIGLGLDGSTALGNSGSGVSIYNGAAGNTIGSTTSGSGNVISAGGYGGISLTGTGTSQNLIAGNLVGTDAGGTLDRGNTAFGIQISQGASSNQVGVAGAGSTFAFNHWAAVMVNDPTSLGNAIRSNSIHDNGGIGIDLAGDGVTANDSAGHVGPNNFQNFPVVTSVSTANGSTTVAGTITGSPNTTYQLDFFSSPGADPSGYGEGQTFLMSAAVTTDGGGTAPFSLATPALVAGGQFITATATDAAGNTSEFSAAVAASAFTLTGVKGLEKSATNAPIASITVTLSQAIDPSSFDGHSLLLTRNGGPNLIKGPVAVTPLGGGSYAIGGLSALTAAEGFYTFTIDAAALKDAGGLHGTGSISRGWVMDTTAPTATISPLSRVGTSLSFTVTINGTDPAGAGGALATGIASFTLYESIDGASWKAFPLPIPASFVSGHTFSGKVSFAGTSSTSYAFYATATDYAGNTTPYKPSLEAYTYLPDLTPPVTRVNPPVGANPSSVSASTGTFTLNLTGTAPGGRPLAYFEVYVGLDLGAGGSTQQVGAAIPAGFPDANGVYHATVTYQGLTDGASHTYKFWSLGIDGAGLTQVTPGTAVTYTNWTFTAQALAVTGLTVERGAAERSYVRYLDVNFNEGDGQSGGQLAGLAGSLGTAVHLYRYDLNGTPASRTAIPLTGPSAGVTASVVDHAIELDFGAGGLGGSPNTTAGDGYYELDVTVGSTTFRHYFDRLLGDVTGDGVVDGADLNAVASELAMSAHRRPRPPERRCQRRRDRHPDRLAARREEQGARAEGRLDAGLRDPARTAGNRRRSAGPGSGRPFADRQPGEHVAERVLVVLPAGDGALVDGLADLGDAGGADRPLVAVELEAGGLPLESAGGDQAAGDRLEVLDGLLVVNVVDGRLQDRLPVVHQPSVLLEPRGDVLGVVGPADAAEIGHPARDGDVAQVAAAVDEGRVGEDGRHQTQVHVIVGHLVADAFGVADGQRADALEVLLAEPLQGRAVQEGHALHGRAGPVDHARDGLEAQPGEPELAGAVDPRMAGDDLLDQRRPRPRQAEDEDRPARRVAGAGHPVEEGGVEVADQAVGEPLVLGRHVFAAAVGQLLADGVGLAQALAGAVVLAAGVEDVRQAEEESARGRGEGRGRPAGPRARRGRRRGACRGAGSPGGRGGRGNWAGT